MQGLMLHCGGNRVELDEVKAVETPEATDSWKPIPHSLLIDVIRAEMVGRGIRVTEEAHALARDGQRYFGLIEVEMPEFMGQEGVEQNLVIGVRNSNDKSFPAQLCLGDRVFVCDNLCFNGQIQLGRKHTKNILKDLPSMVTAAFGQVQGMREVQNARIEAYKSVEMTEKEQVFETYRMFQGGNFPHTMRKHIEKEFLKPSHEEFLTASGNRTVWTLQNAITEAAKVRPNLVELQNRSAAMFGHLDKFVNFEKPEDTLRDNLEIALAGTEVDILS